MKSIAFFVSCFVSCSLFCLRLDIPPIEWKGSGDGVYSVFDNQAYLQEIPVTVYFDEGTETEFFITVSRGNSSSYNRFFSGNTHGNSLSYQIYKDSHLINILKELPDAVENADVINGVIQASDFSPLTTKLYLKIDPKQFAQSGYYYDTLSFALYEGTLAQHSTPSYVQNVITYVQVPYEIKLCVVDSGSSFDAASKHKNIDFGVLQEKAKANFDVVLQCNSVYDLEIQSHNQGVMKAKQVNNPQVVDYDLRFDSTIVNLKEATPTLISTRNVPQNKGEGRHNVEIEIKKVPFVAGDYSDEVTVTARAQP